MNIFPNIESPVSFNEKLQWLKLNNIHPGYGKLVDKTAAKELVASSTLFQHLAYGIDLWTLI